MSRAEKIRKLVNAIKAFCGCKVGDKFLRTPQPHAARRVVKWLDDLGFTVAEVNAQFGKIVSFSSYEELNAWVRGLDKPHPLSPAAVMGGAA